MERGGGDGWDAFKLRAISLGVFKDSCVKFFPHRPVCADNPCYAFLNYDEYIYKGRKVVSIERLQ